MCCSCFLSAKSIQMGQSTHKMFFGCFTIHLGDVIDMFDVSATPAAGIGSCERRASKCLQGHAVFIFVWRLDNLKESLKLETKFRFVYLFDSHEHFNLNRVCQDRDNLTEEMKGCQEDSCWLMLGGKFGKNIQTVEKPWKHVEVQPHLSPKTLFDPSLFQEKLIS